jgi:glycosyl transferase, family 25
MPLTDFFDQIYIINLPQRLDRRREVIIQLKRIGLTQPIDNLQFFPAVRPQSAAGFPSIGARGCFLSHLSILEEAAIKKFQRILIWEDDINFVRNFNKRAGNALRDLCSVEWAIFYGGYRTDHKPIAAAGSAIAFLAPMRTVETTYFIAFQGESIAMAARHLRTMLGREPGDTRGGPMHVDGAYAWFRKENPALKTFLAVPQLGYQRPSQSDIHPGGWYDHIGLGSLLVRFIRLGKSYAVQLWK